MTSAAADEQPADDVETEPGGGTPQDQPGGDQPGGEPGDQPGGEPGDQPGDQPGQAPGGDEPGDETGPADTNDVAGGNVLGERLGAPDDALGAVAASHDMFSGSLPFTGADSIATQFAAGLLLMISGLMLVFVARIKRG